MMFLFNKKKVNKYMLQIMKFVTVNLFLHKTA